MPLRTVHITWEVPLQSPHSHSTSSFKIFHNFPSRRERVFTLKFSTQSPAHNSQMLCFSSFWGFTISTRPIYLRIIWHCVLRPVSLSCIIILSVSSLALPSLIREVRPLPPLPLPALTSHKSSPYISMPPTHISHQTWHFNCPIWRQSYATFRLQCKNWYYKFAPLVSKETLST